jgi:hypothetical protein
LKREDKIEESVEYESPNPAERRLVTEIIPVKN